MKGILIKADTLRNKTLSKEIPNNKPGFYKWWAKLEELKILLNSSQLNERYLDLLLPHLTKKRINDEDYYYIYVGVAIKESIYARLDWHVNQKHSRTSVESGFLSTLRQTLSSLIEGNQYAENATNTFIDKLYIEYYPIDLNIKSEEAKTTIEDIEKFEMETNCLPLNIKDNKNELLRKFLKELKNARKYSKQL